MSDEWLVVKKYREKTVYYQEKTGLCIRAGYAGVNTLEAMTKTMTEMTKPNIKTL